MHKKTDKVILFPKWKKNLEMESLEALEQKDYALALGKLNELIKFDVNNHEILVGKLICLIELGRYDEALDLCEDVLSEKDDHYYQYLHIYLTILFQTNQFEQLISQVEDELTNRHIPLSIKEQFQQLYDISKNIIIEKKREHSIKYFKELATTIKTNNYRKQWIVVENLRKMMSEPTKVIVDYLVDETVHPVVKTSIFNWLREQNVSYCIEIHKLEFEMKIIPSNVKALENHPFYLQVMLLISEIEQKNPTLFHLLEKLFYRYLYVRYPAMPRKEDAQKVAVALQEIGVNYLHNKHLDKNNTTNYLEEITLYEALYLSVIEE